ncbi:hypothetical protein HJFPF1_04630 [Paramyrothecium foliicola]|nr:hypothetical protein HJFPF1_04630 [Paramyrothecium foliicola]
MNWTEGALARHSRRKGWNEEATRQKHYFAKARARLRQEHSQTPKDASSFIPNYIPQHTTQDSQGVAKSGLLQRTLTSRKRLTQTHTFNEPQQVLDDMGRPRQVGLSDRQEDSVEDETMLRTSDPSDFDKKRQRLLERNDWTGVEFQKPIFVDFSWRSDQGDSRAVQQRPRGHVIQKAPSVSLGHKPFAQRLPSPQSMRIRIGSHDFRWSGQSNSVRSTAGLSGQPHTMAESRSASSNHSRTLSTPIFRTFDSAVGSSPNSAGSSPAGHRRVKSQSRPRNHTYSYALPHKRSHMLPDTEDTQLVALSTPPEIHHPQPRRGGWERILLRTRSPGSDATDSIHAQAGGSIGAAMSPKEENRRWREWLGSGEGDVAQRKGQDVSPAPLVSTSRYLAHSGCSNKVRSSSGSWDNKTIINKIRSQGWREPRPQAEEQIRSCRPVPAVATLASSPGLSTTEPVPPFVDSSIQSPAHNFMQDRRIAQVADRFSNSLFKGRLAQEITNKEDHVSVMRTDPSEISRPHVGKDNAGSESDASIDEDEIWRRFILDDNISEIKRTAQAAAQEQTKRELQQAFTLCASDTAQPPSSTEYEGMIRTMTAVEECGSLLKSSPVDGNQSIASTLQNAEFSGHAAASLVAQQGSPIPPTKLQTEFKFHQPQLFIGRLANVASNLPTPTGPPPPPSPSRPAIRRGRGRPPRRRASGRPDFRAMPDLEDDPIEDIC